jgi:hypothetical protein
MKESQEKFSSLFTPFNVYQKNDEQFTAKIKQITNSKKSVHFFIKN